MDPATILMQASIGFIAGYATGYALRKIINFALLVLGANLLVLLYLQQLNVITINWDKMYILLTTIVEGLRGAVTGLELAAASVPLVGFLAGFYLGFTHAGS